MDLREIVSPGAILQKEGFDWFFHIICLGIQDQKRARNKHFFIISEQELDCKWMNLYEVAPQSTMAEKGRLTLIFGD